MGRIKPLDPHVVNKIAAGEVVERPASVVKELLENSLDAGASRITIDVESGGADLIRVSDDGGGIHPDDFRLAVTSHATSKIESDEDLFRVHSMGFRGEALASIASVSRMTIRSRADDHDSGTVAEIEGGTITKLASVGCPPGTTIEVRDLFGNTPVRRKFLKTAGTEFGHISEQFTRIAIANPRLHLTLTHNDKTVYDLPATDKLYDRLELFYGSGLADHLFRIGAEAGPNRLWGYVAHPSQTKSSRKGQYVFLNGRPVQDRSLQHALSEAYRGLVMVGRHPIAFLFFEIPPGDVDVNVHPTKIEVRLRDSQQLYRLLLSTLRSEFLARDLNGTMAVRDRGEEPGASSPQPAFTTGSPNAITDRDRERQRELVNWANEELRTFTPTERISSPVEVYARGEAVPEPRVRMDESDSLPTADVEPSAEHTSLPSDVNPAADHSTSPLPPGSSRVLQVRDCYLVLETEDGLTVIDQHALHERILYEQLRRRVLGGSLESQKLLVPEPIDLPPKDVSVVLDRADLLAELGFGVEPFGNGTVLLTAYPALLRRANLPQLIADLAEKLDRPGRAPDRRELIDSLLHMMACKAAIKAGQRLTPQEIDSLLALRHLVDDAHHCPHGRPTALVLSREELDRQFGRLGAS